MSLSPEILESDKSSHKLVETRGNLISINIRIDNEIQEFSSDRIDDGQTQIADSMSRVARNPVFGVSDQVRH